MFVCLLLLLFAVSTSICLQSASYRINNVTVAVAFAVDVAAADDDDNALFSFSTRLLN